MKGTVALAMAAGLFASACVSDRSKPPQAPGFSWIVQASGTTASLRGVSAVDDRTAWASGSKGTVLRTLDGGSTWTVRPVPGAETTDFRDIEAFSRDEAVIMGIDRPAKIFRTTDGGETWTQTFADDSPGVFLDGLAFFDEKNGLAVGDPTDGRFFVISTTDGGATWASLAAGFAAGRARRRSGLRRLRDEPGRPERRPGLAQHGRPVSRVWRSEDRGRHWEPVPSALLEGSPSAGGFSVAFLDARTGLTVGGDYKAEAAAVGNAAVSADGGKTWRAVEDRRPGGFREAVAFVPGTRPPIAITVGPSGSDLFSRSGPNVDADRHPGGIPCPRFRRAGRGGLGGRPERPDRQVEDRRVRVKLKARL